MWKTRNYRTSYCINIMNESLKYTQSNVISFIVLPLFTCFSSLLKCHLFDHKHFTFSISQEGCGYHNRKSTICSQTSLSSIFFKPVMSKWESSKSDNKTKLDSITYHEVIIVKMIFDNVCKSTWHKVGIQLIVRSILF